MGSSTLDKYGYVMSYLQYENSMYWERSNFYLVAITALFGFTATNLGPLNSTLVVEVLVIQSIPIIAGLFLTILWNRSLLAAEWWIDHWHSILRDLEPSAFGEEKLFREPPPGMGGPKRIRMRSVVKHTLLLFYVLWIMLFGYTIVQFIMALGPDC